jgi:hypothetical protein
VLPSRRRRRQRQPVPVPARTPQLIDSKTLSSLTALDRSSQTELPGSETHAGASRQIDMAAGRAATGYFHTVCLNYASGGAWANARKLSESQLNFHGHGLKLW